MWPSTVGAERRAAMTVAIVAAASMMATLIPACQPARTDVPNPMAIDAAAYAPTYNAAIEVLEVAGFRVVQRDYRFGEIATAPRGSPTIVELWRRDNATLEQAALSTLSDVRRTVRVELQPGQDNGQRVAGGADGGPTGQAGVDYLVGVEVRLERRQVAVRRLTGSTDGGVFDELREVPAEWAQRGIEASYWEPIGRDEHMERRLLSRIRAAAESEAETSAPHEPEPAPEPEPEPEAGDP